MNNRAHKFVSASLEKRTNYIRFVFFYDIMLSMNQWIELLKSRNLVDGIDYEVLEQRLADNPEKLAALEWMEATGGEVMVLGYNRHDDEFLLCDGSEATPIGRRSLCYNQSALLSRKHNPPVGSVEDALADLPLELMDQYHYEWLQQVKPVDLTTSSWIKTPLAILNLKGALFMERRYDTVFVFHNGYASYYSSRGFRVVLRV